MTFTVINSFGTFVAVVQQYTVDVFKTTVLLHNDALLTCVVPSHMGDMVQVTGWVDSEGSQFAMLDKMGKLRS